MPYLDLAQRLEDLDKRLQKNESDTRSTTALIQRLETQLDNARRKHRALLQTRLNLTESKETTRRELNARLG